MKDNNNRSCNEQLKKGRQPWLGKGRRKRQNRTEKLIIYLPKRIVCGTTEKLATQTKKGGQGIIIIITIGQLVRTERNHTTMCVLLPVRKEGRKE